MSLRHPFVLPLLFYVVGLLIGDHLQPPLWILFGAAALLLPPTLLLPRIRLWTLPALLLIAGWTNLATRTVLLSPHDLRSVLPDPPALVTLRGTVAETPSLRTFERDQKQLQRTLALLEVQEILHDKSPDWLPAAGKVLTVTPGQLPTNFFAGQLVELTGVLAFPSQAAAPGLFDYRAYLKRAGVHYQLRTSSTNDWLLLSTPGAPPFADRFITWAQATLAQGLPEQDDSLRLLWAMSLGSREALPHEIYLPFMRTGTMHLFAISGIHIGLIALILVQALRVIIRLPRFYCGLVVVPLLWFYTVATGWQPSAVRATIMSTIIICGWALARPSNLLNSLAAAAFIILLWDPQQLFGASFQLSFSVVLSIALLLPPLHAFRDRLFQFDPLLPPDLAPRWKRVAVSTGRAAYTFSATSVAAWLGSLPLTACYFNIISPVALGANLAMVPAGSLALSSCLGSFVCNQWAPWATELFNHSAWFWMTLMVRISHWALLLPKAFLYVPSPGLPEFVLYYGLLVGGVSGWLLAPSRRPWVLSLLGVVAIAYAVAWQAQRRTVEITVLPLDGGCAVHARAPACNGDLFLDCGRSNHVESIIEPFLQARGINRLPLFILSHGDVAHVGGAERLLTSFRVQNIAVSPARSRSPVYRRLLAQLRDSKAPLQEIFRGHTFAAWQVLHPDCADNFPRGDDNALVLRGEFHGTRVLLLSDLGRDGQDALLAREPNLRADIVVAGLPVSGEPLCESLLDAIQPRLIIIADSEFPPAERASPRLQQRLAARHIPVIYTRSTGTVTLRIGARGWEARACQTDLRLTGPSCSDSTAHSIAR